MLQFESDDFLEITAADILAIQRSRAPVSISVSSGRTFDIRAILCQQQVNKQPVCHLIFYCATFKRALVFGFGGTAEAAAEFRLGAEFLAEMGFLLDPVDLDLKPAMLETVLRDIPPLQKPEYVRRTRKERQSRIAALEKTLKMLGKPSPSSKEGLEHKKTLEQLNAERKTEEHLQTLREHFEKKLSSLDEQLKSLPAAQETKPEAKKPPLQPVSKAVRPVGVGTSAEMPPGTAVGKSTDRQDSPAQTPPAKQPCLAIEAEQPDQRPVGEEKRKPLEKMSDQVPQWTAAEPGAKVTARVVAPQADSATEKELEADPAPGKSEQKELEVRLQQVEQQFQKEIAETSKDLVAARKEIAETSKDLVAARKDLVAVRKELTESSQELEKSNRELAETRKQLAEAQKNLGGLQKQIAQSETETAEFKAELDRLTEQLKAAEQHGKAEEKNRRSLEGELKKVRAELTAIEEESRQLTKQLARVKQDAEQEREEKDALAKDASRTADRLNKLEADLPQLRAEAEAAAEARAEADQLRGRLDQLRGRYEALTRENALLVEEHAAARQQLTAPERQVSSMPEQDEADAVAQGRASARQVAELQKQLATVERQFQDLAGEQEKLAAAYAQEQQQSRGLQQELERFKSAGAVEPDTAVKPDEVKKTPHEQRRPPLPGAFFHVDWDLNGIPCDIGTVSQAWKSIYNVTLSIEGYPHQYVEALIVLLKETAKPRLHLIFRLDGEGRNLVYRPAQPINNDAALKKGLEEARNFLRVSGIEVESVPAGQLKKVLLPYLTQA